jgi:hypothetical protein
MLHFGMCKANQAYQKQRGCAAKLPGHIETENEVIEAIFINWMHSGWRHFGCIESIHYKLRPEGLDDKYLFIGHPDR